MPKSTTLTLTDLPNGNVSDKDAYNSYTNFILNIGDPILIQQGESFADLGWGPYQFPFLYYTNYGSVICTWNTGVDKITGEGENAVQRPSSAVSDDGGITWRERTSSDSISYESRSLMSNGNYFAGFVGQDAYVAKDLDTSKSLITTYEKKKLFLPSDLVEADVLDLTYQAREYDPNTGTVTTFDCTVNWPTQLISVYYNAGNKDYEDNTVHPPQREFALGNGLGDLTVEDKLYFAMYARGLAPDTLTLGKYSEYFSVFVFCSEDNARTWNLVSQIDVTDAVFEEAQSYNSGKGFGGLSEPTMSLMPDGSIVILMRTGDNRPCYLARSTDGCQSWSDPVKFDEVGVRPFIVTLECGISLASYGRDGLFIRATSDPSGLEWQEHIEITLSEPTTAGQKQSCYYTYILPLSENSALLVYSDFHYSDTGNAADVGKSILGRIITVDPSGLTVGNTSDVGNSENIDCSDWLQG